MISALRLTTLLLLVPVVPALSLQATPPRVPAPRTEPRRAESPRVPVTPRPPAPPLDKWDLDGLRDLDRSMYDLDFKLRNLDHDLQFRTMPEMPEMSLFALDKLDRLQSSTSPTSGTSSTRWTWT